MEVEVSKSFPPISNFGPVLQHKREELEPHTVEKQHQEAYKQCSEEIN